MNESHAHRPNERFASFTAIYTRRPPPALNCVTSFGSAPSLAAPPRPESLCRVSTTANAFDSAISDS